MLKKNYDAQGKAGILLSYSVAGGVHIFSGAMVCVNGRGYLVPGENIEGYIFVGVAYEECNNKCGSDGAGRVRVMKGGTYLYDVGVADIMAQSDVGKVAYLVDDHTVSLIAGFVPIGYLVEVPLPSRVRVRIDRCVA